MTRWFVGTSIVFALLCVRVIVTDGTSPVAIINMVVAGVFAVVMFDEEGR